MRSRRIPVLGGHSPRSWSSLVTNFGPLVETCLFLMFSSFSAQSSLCHYEHIDILSFPATHLCSVRHFARQSNCHPLLRCCSPSLRTRLVVRRKAAGRNRSEELVFSFSSFIHIFIFVYSYPILLWYSPLHTQIFVCTHIFLRNHSRREPATVLEALQGMQYPPHVEIQPRHLLCGLPVF